MLTIYSKTECPFCIMAKSLLDTYNITYNEVNIEENLEARNKILEAGLRSVPQIYFEDQLFVEGGYQGLKSMGEDGLKQRLSECIEGWDRIVDQSAKS